MAQSCLKWNGREYIRHPTDVPILVRSVGNPQQMQLPLNNISQGGLAFESPIPFDIGSPIEIKIKADRRTFKAHGIVQWCTEKEDYTIVGIEFCDYESAFKVRMIEQVCHIEHYKKEVKEKEGRKLNKAHAAMEWIERHGSEFPNPK